MAVCDTQWPQCVSTHQIWNTYLKLYWRYAPEKIFHFWEILKLRRLTHYLVKVTVSLATHCCWMPAPFSRKMIKCLKLKCSADQILTMKSECVSFDLLWVAIWSFSNTRPYSAVDNVSCNRCESDCRSRGREFDPGLVPYFSGDWSWNNIYGLWNNFFRQSPPFRWIIQEGLLSVTSESMCSKYWLTACSSLPRKKCG